jgi:hypothetical protein
MQLVRERPAITESCFQLKWNWMIGVCPTGAQVRTRVGRSDSPDSSTKTIKRPSRSAFFKRRPSAPFPGADRLFVSFQGALFGLLAGKPQLSQQTPHVHFAVAHTKQTLDNLLYALERPEFGAKAVRRRAFQ